MFLILLVKGDDLVVQVFRKVMKKCLSLQSQSLFDSMKLRAFSCVPLCEDLEALYIGLKTASSDSLGRFPFILKSPVENLCFKDTFLILREL